MIRPVLRQLHSPDVPDLAALRPRDPQSFSILIQAMFGPSDGAGQESFDFILCTPAWLATEAQRVGVVDGRHHLIVETYDLARLRDFLERYADRCSGDTWQECAGKLSRLGRWEFEDYKPA